MSTRVLLAFMSNMQLKRQIPCCTNEKKSQFGLMSLCIPVNVLRAFTNVYAILAHVKLDCSDIAHAHCAMSNWDSWLIGITAQISSLHQFGQIPWVIAIDAQSTRANVLLRYFYDDLRVCFWPLHAMQRCRFFETVHMLGDACVDFVWFILYLKNELFVITSNRKYFELHLLSSLSELRVCFRPACTLRYRQSFETITTLCRCVIYFLWISND